MAVIHEEALHGTQWPEAITTLLDEHRYMSLLLDTLAEKVQGENEIAAPDYFLIHDVVRYMDEYPDAVHHPTEDLMFAKLVVRDPSMKKIVEDLQRDHQRLTDNTGRILKLLRVAEREQSPAAADAVREACATYIERLQAHMQIEESELFPRATACLTLRDWKLIESRLDAVEDPLFGRRVDSRFRVLYEYFSGQAGDVSQRITRFSFLQFDSIIESADSLEQGVGAMISMLTREGKSVVDESRAIWNDTVENPGVGTVIGNQWRFAALVGKKAATISGAAAGIYWNTAKEMLAPFLSQR